MQTCKTQNPKPAEIRAKFSAAIEKAPIFCKVCIIWHSEDLINKIIRKQASIAEERMGRGSGGNKHGWIHDYCLKMGEEGGKCTESSNSWGNWVCTLYNLKSNDFLSIQFYQRSWSSWPTQSAQSWSSSWSLLPKCVDCWQESVKLFPTGGSDERGIWPPPNLWQWSGRWRGIQFLRSNLEPCIVLEAEKACVRQL